MTDDTRLNVALVVFLGLARLVNAAPVNQVTVIPSFDNPSVEVQDMTLNCSVCPTEPVKGWRWESDLDGDGWTEVDVFTHNVNSGVTVTLRSPCRLYYSTLYRVLRATDLDRRYRCFVLTDDGPQVQFAGYYKVPLAAIQGRLANSTQMGEQGSRDFLRFRSYIQAPQRGHKPGDMRPSWKLYTLIIPTVCGAAVIVAGMVGAFFGFLRGKTSKSADGPSDLRDTQKSPSPPTTLETTSTVSSCHMASPGSSLKSGAGRHVGDRHCSMRTATEHVRFVEQLDSKGVARLEEGRTSDRWSLAGSLESADSAVDEKEATPTSVVDAEVGQNTAPASVVDAEVGLNTAPASIVDAEGGPKSSSGKTN